ncbi:MAG: Ig-like domain-containing protein, partial [Armatimonadetes bacterium]|nr:Ig-like domain-containing protein [Armatimonadota bacterium]
TRNLTASLKRKTDKLALAGRTMTFKIDSVVVGTAETDASGNAKLAYKVAGLSVGAHPLTAEFAGDGDYEPTTAASTLTIIKGKTKLGANTTSSTIGETVTFNASLVRTTDNMKLAGKTVKFKLGSLQLGTAVTDATGKASVSFLLDERLPAGVVALTTTFAGDDDYVSSSGAGVLTISKAKSKLATKNSEGVRGTTVVLTATLTRVSDSLLLSGRTVRFQLDGSDVGTAKTDANGIASLSYVIPSTASLGSHPKAVIFDGDGYYLGYTGGGTTLTVK